MEKDKKITEDIPEGLASVITDAYHALREVTCVEDVYDLIDYLVEEVKHHYTHISCKIGCDSCCTALHPPFISAAEWEYILYYINDFPQIIKDEIVRRGRWFAAEYRDALLLQIALAKGEIPPQEMEKTYKTLSRALKISACPFLVIDRCGIYPVRPAKCRAHGYFLVQIGETIRVHTCLPEVSNWEEFLRKQNHRRLTMPLWNVFEKVISILNPPDSLVATIPVWLITHISGNKLLTEVNPNPKINL